jgi:hypothetical protein
MIKFSLAMILATLVLASCTKNPTTDALTDEPVEKKVVYNIAAAKDYTPAIYDNMQTEIKLTVGVASTKTGDYTKLWDTTIAGHMRSFPRREAQMHIEKTFRILETAEQLQVSYYIRYDNNGHMEQVSSFKPVAKGTRLLQERISL